MLPLPRSSPGFPYPLRCSQRRPNCLLCPPLASLAAGQVPSARSAAAARGMNGLPRSSLPQWRSLIGVGEGLMACPSPPPTAGDTLLALSAMVGGGPTARPVPRPPRTGSGESAFLAEVASLSSACLANGGVGGLPSLLHCDRATRWCGVADVDCGPLHCALDISLHSYLRTTSCPAWVRFPSSFPVLPSSGRSCWRDMSSAGPGPLVGVDVARRKIYRAVSRFVLAGSSRSIAHSSISFRDPAFYRDDGVHLSDPGMGRWLHSIWAAWREWLG
uniref:Uncharacterized protein n=1 Tax=Sphaerodactylus townsendi TaxID=933632 RepID=A0ACB8FHW5_9SAUR